ALAVWFRQARHVFATGLLLNSVGLTFWLAWGPETPASFLWTNAFGLAISSCFLAALELALAQWVIPDQDSPFSAYTHFAVHLALGLAVVVIALALTGDLTGVGASAADALALAALAASAAALATALWDP